jgi:HAMP domain-containing protein
MGLRLKFNLVLLLVFITGLGVTGYVSYELLHRNARDEVLRNAGVMMEAALSMRGYTVGQVRPNLVSDPDKFLPQSVPAFGATEIMHLLQKKYSDYAYKEATLNPTNPRNRAVEWETDIVNQFRNNKDSNEIIGDRDTPTGRSFYVARPLRVGAPTCLQCHSTVDAAPATMIERYGPANGFGWTLNEVIGAQIISVPTRVPLDRAQEAFKVFMTSTTAVFVVIGLVLNLMLWMLVIRPVTKLSQFADRVSLGELEIPEFKRTSRDEIGVLARSIGRMRTSMVQAMKMLDS